MESEPDAKRMAAAVAAAAAAAAAAANADAFGSLRSPGGMAGRGPGGGMAGMAGMAGATMIGLGPVSSEEIAVPDKMVGLSKSIGAPNTSQEPRF